MHKQSTKMLDIYSSNVYIQIKMSCKKRFPSPLSRQISIHWIIICGAIVVRYMPKLVNIAELKTALLSIWNSLPQEFTDKAILSFW